jgi:hypothetical protein
MAAYPWPTVASDILIQPEKGLAHFGDFDGAGQTS